MSTRQRAVKTINLPVWFLKEGGTYIAYTPALELSTCGSTFEETQRRFGEAVTLYFEECLKRGTLEDALTSYGWQKVSKPTRRWIPPLVVGHTEVPVHLPA